MEWSRDLAQRAERGDGKAQYELGMCYERGYGIARIYAKAKYWYEKAVEHEYAEAASALAYMYDQGLGVAVDKEEAANLYLLASGWGDSLASCNLGVYYENGWGGLKQNFSEAVKYYQLAAKDNAHANYCLGACYDNGRGVSKNGGKAEECYRRAYELGSGLAANVLGNKSFEKGEYKEAVDYYQYALYNTMNKKAKANACERLYEIYLKGYGVEPSFEEAQRYLNLKSDILK